MLQKANYLFDHPFIKDNTLLWMSWILKNFENVVIYFHYFSQYRIVWHLLKVDQRSLRRKWVHWVSCSRANRPCQLYKSPWKHFAETKIIAGHSWSASCASCTETIFQVQSWPEGISSKLTSSVTCWSWSWLSSGGFPSPPPLIIPSSLLSCEIAQQLPHPD